MSIQIDTILSLIEARRAGGRKIVVISIVGRSGAGKTTFAKQLSARIPASVVDGDAFFAGGVGNQQESAAERADFCIDWRRQRAVLKLL
jgi:uridine kinase